jgi:hypothetical protein
MAGYGIAVSILLLLTASTPSAVALTDSTLTTDQLHTVLCVWTIANQYFVPGSPLVVSLPSTTPDVARSALTDPLPQGDNLQMVNVLLGKLHETTRWPIELFRPSGQDTPDTSVLHNSYILFVWNGEASSLNETIENQMERLKYSTSWNPRGRFLVVATDSSNEPAHLLAVHICSILWQMARIVNVVVLIPNQIAYRPLHVMSTTKTTAADRLNLYTWSPFTLGGCGEVRGVTLLNEWVFENNGGFSENAHLYPSKVPKTFMGCPINVGALGIDPYVIITENYTQNDGRISYKLTGLSVEILKFVCEKMNLTTIFFPPSLNIEFNSLVKEIADVEDDLSDVLIGVIPLIPVIVTSSFDATIPFTIVELKMLVPCPKAIPGTQKVLTTFSLFVWLTLCFVLLLATAVFWCAGNGPYRSVCNETHKYWSLSHCFYNAWAVFVGVSVSQQPRSSNLRVFFFLYVCFCFAISTVFQAFFVSYLVEPTYEKKLETLDELLDSYVVYGYHPFFNFIQDTLSSPEIVRFLELKKLKEDCSDLRKCVERILTKRDISSVIAPFFATYVAREMGTVGVGKVICSLDETLVSGGLTVLFKKGNPLLDTFNILMRRYLEAGLLESHWTELQHRAALRGGGEYGEAAGDMFFAFSLSHLMPAFVVLLVGTVLSLVVFTAELIVSCLFKRRIKKDSRIRRVSVSFLSSPTLQI